MVCERIGYWWCCDADEKPAEDWRQGQGEEWDGDDGEDGPEDEGVPLP